MKQLLTSASILSLSALLVNGGNYFCNYLMSRFLTVAEFAEANLIVTLFMSVSFLATAFQLTAAKAVSESAETKSFTKLYSAATFAGLIVGATFIIGASFLQKLLHTSTPAYFYVLGLTSPVYFVMSAGRGFLQGETAWKKWMLSYQLEMWVRLLLTIGLMYMGMGVWATGIGIMLSVVAACITIPKVSVHFSYQIGQQLRHFFVGIIVYELAQIVINNGDILLVKYYFDAESAGKYAVLALIGKISYFATWVIAQYMIGEVLQMEKAGKNATAFFLTIIAILGGLTFCLVAGIHFFSDTIIQVAFGTNYLGIASLLGKYALLSGIFAICNIFVYYHLFFHRKTPLYMTLIFAAAQIGFILLFHHDLAMVVKIQLICVSFLFAALLGYQMQSFVKSAKATVYRMAYTIHRK